MTRFSGGSARVSLSRVGLSLLCYLCCATPASAQQLNLDSVQIAGNSHTSTALLELRSDPARSPQDLDGILAGSEGKRRSVLDQPASASAIDTRTVIENWIVVSLLGIGFTVGLIITVGTIRQSGAANAPPRLF